MILVELDMPSLLAIGHTCSLCNKLLRKEERKLLKPTEAMVIAAAQYGSYSFLRWMVEYKGHVDNRACDETFAGLLSKPLVRHKIAFVAATKGCLETLQWIASVEPGYVITPSVLVEVAIRVHYPVWRWYEDNDFFSKHHNDGKGYTSGWWTGAVEHAIHLGQLESLEWLWKHTSKKWTLTTYESTMKYALEVGDTGIANWLLIRGIAKKREERDDSEASWKWSSSYYVSALDHWTSMNWLKEKGCPLDSTVTTIAAERENYELLEWMREAGYPFTISDWEAAIRKRNVGTLEWLKKHATFKKLLSGYFLLNTSLEVAKWLRENGCPWHESAIEWAIPTQDVARVQWLIDSGCPCSDPVAAMRRVRGAWY